MNMEYSLQDGKLTFLFEMLECAEDLYFWTYDRDLQLLDTNCADLVLHQVFSHTGCLKYMGEYAREHTHPLILTTAPGLMWAAVFEHENGQFSRAHVLGPVVHVDISLGAIEQALRGIDIPLSWKSAFVGKIQRLPIISNISFAPYVLMLHFCVTGERLTRSDIEYQQNNREVGGPAAFTRRKDRHKIWMAEQALLRMVREGDLNYKSALSQSASLSNGVRVDIGDPLAQAKLSAVSFVTLCVRAAIDGGLSPEFAYSKGDAYIQSAMLCKTLSDIVSINHTMYDDFIRCVHKCRTNPQVSRPVQSCCDYIELHIDEPLSIELLAKRLGYTEYYLSRKFKREMHVSINDYIKCARVEFAKMLLTTSTDGVQEISDRLHFCSRSYFSEVFREIAGMTPVEYRRRTQRI